ncbi:MAG: hypothetical protein JWP38_2849 [Herbaspirillum sp.]|jgi:uncharacterized protein YigA (DUF484 family)|nr:hypothetical protein [Herbaspirillum sp.]
MTALLDSNLIADYLLDHPHFFEEHAELLGRIKLTSPVLGRAISLQERQMEILREKIKLQDLHMAELSRNAVENNDIADKLLLWTRALLAARDDGDLPRMVVEGLKTIFEVPQVTMRLWRVDAGRADAKYVETTSDDVHLFAEGMTAPYCGPNEDFEAALWLGEPAVRSLAILPLRLGSGGDASPRAFGLLVLGSEDPQRFSAKMSTDFLSHISAAASAALTSIVQRD